MRKEYAISIAVLARILCHKVVHCEVSKKYVLETAGVMHDLLQPLRKESYWIPAACKVALNQSESEIETEINRKRKSKSRRPHGWQKGTLRYGEFILDEAVKSIFRTSSHKYYPFACKQLCSEDFDIRAKRLAKTDPLYHRSYDEFITLERQKDCSNLPDLRSKSWGSCAFVAPGSNLLKYKRGEQIELQDTVIRLGHMPLSGWSEFVGSRTDILIGRGTIQSQHAHIYNSLKYLIGKDSSDARGRRTIGLQIADSLNFIPELRRLHGVKVNIGIPQVGTSLYHVMTSPIGKKNRGSTTGFLHALRIVFSGLCSKVHIFGLSAECGGYYYNQKVRMKLHHSCELESWALHYLMKKHHESTNLCIWNA